MTTRVLATVALLLTASARADGVAVAPEASPDRAAQAPAKDSSPGARPEPKHAKKQRKSSEAPKPAAAKARGAEQEKAKPCEEVKPCAIE